VGQLLLRTIADSFVLDAEQTYCIKTVIPDAATMLLLCCRTSFRGVGDLLLHGFQLEIKSRSLGPRDASLMVRRTLITNSPQVLGHEYQSKNKTSSIVSALIPVVALPQNRHQQVIQTLHLSRLFSVRRS
jgi:hypothetical protein